MSKLDEVIEMLYHVLIFKSWNVSSDDSGVKNLKVVETYDLKPVIDALLELNKPPQYTVEIKRKEGEPGIFFYEATCYNKMPIGRSNTIELIKEYVFAQLNIMAEILSMPTIIIDQIKFLEV